MEPRFSQEQSRKIGLPIEECQELQSLSLAIQLAEAKLRQLAARRDEIVFGWQKKYEILDWTGWRIDLRSGVLTPPVAQNNGTGGAGGV